MPEEINLDNLSLEELRKLANEPEAVPEVVQEPVTPTQPRDEHGRFVKSPDPDAAPSGEPDAHIFRRVIDVGGDAGAEVFESDTLEGLVDKIAEGKRNATLKIRTQEAELKKLRATGPVEERTFTPDEEFVYSQELLSNPTQAFKKLFKDVTGVDIAQFKTVQARTQAMVEADARNQTVNAFLASHPDYADTPRNGKLIQKWTANGPFTAETLSEAYEDLKESGLLDLKDSAAPATPPEPVVPPAPVTPAPPVRRSSGISTRSSAPAPVKTAPTEEDLYNMPMEQLRALANRQQG
jgi:hypothetical protein